MGKQCNPIKSVDGMAVPCPSSYVWKLDDLPASDSARTEDTVMHKMRLGQIVSLDLGWSYVDMKQASVILKAFDADYVEVEYLDAREGRYLKNTFYVGGRSAPLFNSRLGRWESISFTLEKRSGV